MNASGKSNERLVFDHQTIRLIIGIIALGFPFAVALRILEISPSISWSYWAKPSGPPLAVRDLFVGFLFIIGAFLFSYKGHKHGPAKPGSRRTGEGKAKFRDWPKKLWAYVKRNQEDVVSIIGGVAALSTALFPTAQDPDVFVLSDPVSTTHYIAAVFVFLTTIYFCLVAFKSCAKPKRDKAIEDGDDPAPMIRRIWLYRVCGWGIAVVMAVAAIAAAREWSPIPNFVFWAEAVALWLFGIGWVTASKTVPGLATEEELPQFMQSMMR
jgi:hypothetical protein